MKRFCAWVAFVLLAGCTSDPGEGLDVSPSETLRGLETAGPPAVRAAASDRFFLNDPEVLGVRAPGLRVLNFTNNVTTRLNAAVAAGAGNSIDWILVLPTEALQNQTQGCSAAQDSWRIRHFGVGTDTLTNQPLPAGNWSLLVRSSQLTNLTLFFNTTTLTGYRVHNGSLLGWSQRQLDADVQVESDTAPYRVTFNKTFQAPGPGIVVGHFGVRGDAFAQFREMRSKIESSDGFLCAEHRNEAAQPATGGSLWSSLVVARIGDAGAYSFAGRFEASAGVNARPAAGADVLLSGAGPDLVPNS